MGQSAFRSLDEEDLGGEQGSSYGEHHSQEFSYGLKLLRQWGKVPFAL
jgi:hypothetical protein